MKVLIDDYRNSPGEHCGSAAMRNLIYYYCGLDIPEEVVFGLGSGIDCMTLEDDEPAESSKSIPPVASFGRSVTFEVDICLALGVDYREQPELDDEKAWQTVRQEVLEGRPTMLSGDVFYLDHRNASVHFPSHRFVLVGFDDDPQAALIADRNKPEPQACSYRALRRSRNPPLPISTFNIWGKFHDTTVRRSIVQAHGVALHKTARRMLGQDESQASLTKVLARGRKVRVTCGLDGLKRYREILPTWRDRNDGPKLLAYAAGCIEKYGTGGGNFRKLYAAFLDKARLVVPDLVDEEMPQLAAQSAALWTELYGHLRSLANDGPEEGWDSSAEVLSRIIDTETELFESLGTKTGT